MRLDYLIRRIILFFVVVWVAATINFVLPRLSRGNAIRNQLTQQAATGGYVQNNIDAMVAEYDKEFGLDKPVWRQYVDYASGALRGDLGISFARQNKPVTQVILSGFRVTAR